MTGVLRGIAIVPVTGDVEAMSDRRRAELLRGHDPVMVLEAASTVLAAVETSDTKALLEMMPRRDAASIAAWARRVRGDARVHPSPVHPLAVLAATTLALGTSEDGVRSDETRQELSSRLIAVALRFNEVVTGLPTHGADVLNVMGRAALWRAVESEDWLFWVADLLEELHKVEQAAAVLAAFSEETNLSVDEWFFRGVGERATRRIHGAGSWSATTEVDTDLEVAWQALTMTPVEEAKSRASEALIPSRHSVPTVANPFDLHWLHTRPYVMTPDARRFPLWIGAMTRSLLPASVAQLLADTTSTRYDHCSELLGRAAELALWRELESVPDDTSFDKVGEDEIPGGGQRCDVVFVGNDLAVGIDFTMITPTRDLTAGTPEALDQLVGRLAKKFSQVYASLTALDPSRSRRWLPLVVLASPSVVEPLLNEAVHRRLQEQRVIGDEDSELMTCHAPEFLDLLELARSGGTPVPELVGQWRDSDYRGASLDWWLSDAGALRASGRRRVDKMASRAADVLTRQG